MPAETFSGVKSYHDMLHKAQSLSPALTYVVCNLLRSIPAKNLETDERHVYSRVLNMDSNDEPFSTYFAGDSNSEISQFLKVAFSSHNVFVKWADDYGYRKRLKADKQFVRWLKGDVVQMHDKDELVTICP